MHPDDQPYSPLAAMLKDLRQVELRDRLGDVQGFGVVNCLLFGSIPRGLEL
jgi:hypothetical protein